ncbi:MAG: hypothetical protein UH241_07135 [Acutalibacteraceae bacterium]|nr:hypothetical protein [Acutalibacteraceae bacterium]
MNNTANLFTSNKTISKECIYLNVSYINKEFNASPVDILTDARHKYFSSNRKKIKDKVFFSVNGIKYSYSYQIDPKGKIKWKTTTNGEITEEIALEPAGYIIVFKQLNGFVSKKMYFNHTHIWQKTDYYSPNSIEPELTLMPWLNDDRAAIALYDKTSSFPQILYVLPLTANQQLLQKAISVCQPEVSATINNTTYYFGDDETENQWNSIIQENKDNLKLEHKNTNKYFDTLALQGEAKYINLADTTDVFNPNTSVKKSEDEKIITHTSTENINDNNIDSDDKAVNTANKQINSKLPVITGNNDVSDSKVVQTKANSSNIEKAQYDKQVVLSQKEKGVYIGELDNENKRHGFGKTQTLKGQTLYEGEYKDDMKNGFGVTYFKSGKLAYVGNHQDDKYEGFGIEFRATDGSISVGEFSENSKVFVFAKFDKNGKLSFVGNKFGNDINNIYVDNTNGELFIPKTDNGEILPKGTILSANGTLLYSGDYKNGNKDGKGTLFNSDGTIKYSGDFKRNQYSGTGILHYPDGSIYKGEFSANLPNGKGALQNADGTPKYIGQWKKGEYSGDGRLYNQDGSYYDGKFSNGLVKGKLVIYDSNGVVKYNGTVINNLPDGNGICYENGIKTYDGQLSEGKKCGTGRLYSNGECVYMGSFENDLFSGFGISYDNSIPIYSGMWSNGKYHGAGLLRINNETLLAGSFINGEPNGRINVIKNNTLIGECIYNRGECEYMREYSDDGYSVVYDGNIKDSLRNGMGCVFSEYGEKLFEGIFQEGNPFKSMKVSLKELEPLEYVSKLKDTDYEKFRISKEFVVEQPIQLGVYSGQLCNGLPEGKGTILYSDHRYIGFFKNGKACGKGVLYFGDGTVLEGSFSEVALVNTKAVEFANVVYNIFN